MDVMVSPAMGTMYFLQKNSAHVTVRYPEVSDGGGIQSEFYYKDCRSASDSDPATRVYTSTIDEDELNPGGTFSQFYIPPADNSAAGSFWWRIDITALDVDGDRITVGYGTLLVEAV